MLETEKQRRWWFATHPEFSWGHTGKRSKRHDDENGDSDRMDPDAVDAYVDEQLAYATDPVIIQLLESTKFWFGTEFASKSPAEKRALLQDEDDEDEEQEEDQTAQVQRRQQLPGHPAADRDSYDRYEDVLDSIDRLRGPDAAKNESTAPSKYQRALELARDILPWVQFVIGVAARKPRRLPLWGTRERAKIEADRSRGTRAKRREELADIQAGGKGSGVWTEEELETIRKTNNFPLDTRWHHDPTVANRPDLAADPRVVHPLRGGDKGHLMDGHGGNYGNPRE